MNNDHSILSDGKILELIGQMRGAQAEYFRMRRERGRDCVKVIAALREARRLEDWVDLWLARARSRVVR